MTQTSLPDVPRDQWPNHPNFPNQVLLLGSHENFRHVSGVLVEAARAGEPVASLRSLYVRWIGAMRNHEGYEEHKLYPFLSRRWGVSFEPSKAGHDELHEAHDEVLAAFGNGENVIEALERHDHVLRAHLEVEEEQVIPLLLSLSPAEFSAYYHGRTLAD